MPSLYQSPSWAAPVCASSLMLARTFMTALGVAFEQEGRIGGRVDVQADTVPLKQAAIAGDEIFDFAHRPARVRRADLGVAEVEPEAARLLGKRYDNGDGIAAVHRFLDEADHVRIVGLQEAEVCRLQQRRVFAADRIELAQIGLDVAGLV